jgi:hypothetical protein
MVTETKLTSAIPDLGIRQSNGKPALGGFPSACGNLGTRACWNSRRLQRILLAERLPVVVKQPSRRPLGSRQSGYWLAATADKAPETFDTGTVGNPSKRAATAPADLIHLGRRESRARNGSSARDVPRRRAPRKPLPTLAGHQWRRAN